MPLAYFTMADVWTKEADHLNPIVMTGANVDSVTCMIMKQGQAYLPILVPKPLGPGVALEISTGDACASSYIDKQGGVLLVVTKPRDSWIKGKEILAVPPDTYWITTNTSTV